MNSDMSDMFRSLDGGETWTTLDFRSMQGMNLMCWMQFTPDPNVRYALSSRRPMKTTNGGASWFAIDSATGSGTYSLFADDQRTNRLFVSNYTTIYLSTNGGTSYTAKYTSNDLHIAGAFWDGSSIFIGTRAGLVMSTNSGTTFFRSAHSGIPATESMASFTGAKAGSTTRFYCVTYDAGSVYPTMAGYGYSDFKSIYRMDYAPGASWTRITNGIGGDYGFMISAIRTNTGTAWFAGASANGEPVVYRTINNGTSWQKIMNCPNNQNVFTGWSGDDAGPWNWRKWSYGECALGFNVCPNDPNRMIITDFGFVHITTNGGGDWKQVYGYSGGQNSTNTSTDKVKSYYGAGLEDTSCWYLTWPDSNNLFACFTDMRGIMSTNGGRSWLFPPTLAYNSTYETVQHPTNGILYGAMSSVHDMYAWDQYCQDSRIDPGTGEIMYSTNKGLNWARFKNLGKPIVALALDPTNHNRLYASMVNSVSGGIYRTSNLNSGTNSTWTKLPNPPRTEGHPYVIRILNDGTIVCSYSARISANNFTQSAGVFVSTNDGVSWVDRSAAGMMYYTKDVVIDPHDPAQRKWYAGVWSEWGNSSGLGGIYYTTNRGVAWTKITTNINQVGSVTIHPVRTNEMYACTENDGLWLTTNRNVAVPSFSPVMEYPFRFPSRVFFNPWNVNEVWVTSFGNGLRLGRDQEPVPTFTTLTETSGEVSSILTGGAGQRMDLHSSTNLQGWTYLRSLHLIEDSLILTNDLGDPARFFSTRLVP